MQHGMCLSAAAVAFKRVHQIHKTVGGKWSRHLQGSSGLATSRYPSRLRSSSWRFLIRWLLMYGSSVFHTAAKFTARMRVRMRVSVSLYADPPQNVHTTWDLGFGGLSLRPHMGPTQRTMATPTYAVATRAHSTP